MRIDWRRRQNLHPDTIAVHLLQVALEIPGREGRLGPTRHHRSCPCRLFHLDFRGIGRGELSQIGLWEAVRVYIDVVHKSALSEMVQAKNPHPRCGIGARGAADVNSFQVVGVTYARCLERAPPSIILSRPATTRLRTCSTR